MSCSSCSSTSSAASAYAAQKSQPAKPKADVSEGATALAIATGSTAVRAITAQGVGGTVDTMA